MSLDGEGQQLYGDITYSSYIFRDLEFNCHCYSISHLKMTEKIFTEDDFDLFRDAARIICVGPSNSGKSQIIKKIIERDHSKFDRIVLCGSNAKNFGFDEYLANKVIFRDDVTNPFDEKISPSCRLFIIYDDLYEKITNDINILRCFTRGRHESISICVTMQNLFSRVGKFNRDILLNASHFFLTRQRDLGSVEILSRQIVGSKSSKKLLEAYKLAISKPYSHFLIDVRVDTPQELMLQSNTFCEEYPFIRVFQI